MTLKITLDDVNLSDEQLEAIAPVLSAWVERGICNREAFKRDCRHALDAAGCPIIKRDGKK